MNRRLCIMLAIWTMSTILRANENPIFIQLPKKSVPRNDLACLMHGAIGSSEAKLVLDQYGNGPLASNLLVAYSRILSHKGEAQAALDILNAHETFEGTELVCPWTEEPQFDKNAGHQPPPSDAQWFQKWYIDHCREFPNSLHEVALLEKGKALLGLGKTLECLKIATEIITQGKSSVKIDAADQKFLTRIEEGKHAGQRDFRSPAILLGIAPTKFMFRSEIARSLGMPHGVPRPWRDALLLRAECYGRDAKWFEAATDLDSWLSSYAFFYCYEDQIKASRSRAEYLVKAGQQEEAEKEKGRTLNLCDEYTNYLERGNICFDVDSILELPKSDPNKLLSERKSFIAGVKKELVP